MNPEKIKSPPTRKREICVSHGHRKRNSAVLITRSSTTNKMARTVLLKQGGQIIKIKAAMATDQMNRKILVDKNFFMEIVCVIKVYQLKVNKRNIKKINC